MKGLLRVYDDGEIFKCKLKWAVVKDNYLNFFEEKKNQDPSSFVNLSGCQVKKIFNNSYNINVIEVTTPRNHSIQFAPDNIKDFNKWMDVLYEASVKFRDSYESDLPVVTPRASRTIVNNSPRQSSKNSNPNMRLPNQNARYSSNNPGRAEIVDRRERNSEYSPGPNSSHRKPSGQIPRNRHSNGLDSSNGLQRPKRDRRESSDSFVKGNYTQLPIKNHRKPSAGYSETNVPAVSGYRLSHAIETVKEDPMMSDDEILETKPLEELRRKYPITDKTKRWSIAATDLIGKSNDELFLMLIQLNREKSHMEIWKDTLEKYIDEIDEALKERLSMQAVNELESNRAHYVEQLNNIEYLMNLAHPLISFMDAVVQMSDAYGGNNDAFHVAYHQASPTGDEDFTTINFIRHNQEKQVAKLINDNSQNRNSLPRDTGSDKENDPAILLNLNNTEEFLNRKAGLIDIIEDIASQLQILDPIKSDIENFIANMDSEFDGIPMSKGTNGLPIVNSKGSMKSVKSLKDNELKVNNLAFMPRRSTRKAPKSDMIPSIKRKEGLKTQPSIGTRSQNPSLRYGQFTSQDSNDNLRIQNTLGRHSFHSTTANNNNEFVNPVRMVPQSVTPRSQKSKTPTTNLSDSIARSSSSKVQNQLRDLMRTDPYTENRPPSPIYRAPSSILGVPDIESGPLIKLNANLFQNPHGPRRPFSNNDTVVQPPMSRISVSESDISACSRDINQRLNLNQFVDDNKHWKNPGRNSSGLSTPEKVNIGERYRASITEDDDNIDMNAPRSRKMRQLVANESFSRMTKDDIGQQNQRESMLLNNSRLAHEASRKSRNLQKI